MMMIYNRCALRRIPTTLLALRSTAYQATPSRRDATTMTLLPGLGLGFPLICRGVRRRGTPGALQEGMAAPVGVTASVPAIRQGFLPTPKKPRPPTLHRAPPKLVAHQLAPPRSCNHHRRLIVNKVARPTGPRRDIQERGAARQWTHRRAQPPPPMSVTDRTQQ
jgi:hypothetical protein